MHIAPTVPAGPAGLVTAVLLVVLSLVSAPQATAAERARDGITGYAFDARCAPTQEQMDAWLTTSPAAVRHYQDQVGLAPTTVVAADTWSALQLGSR